MDIKALYKISYGLYIVSVAYEGKLNGCVVNTVMQITSQPAKCVVAISKNNYTHDMVINAKSFSVSILSQSVSMNTIARFGFSTGKEVNKFDNFSYKKDINGNPVLTKELVASMACQVYDTVDAGTHTLFMANIMDSEVICEEEPLTYDYYRTYKKGITPKNAPTFNPDAKKENEGKYRCSICGYVYDGEVPFEELPDDYVCPICKNPKSVFEKI